MFNDDSSLPVRHHGLLTLGSIAQQLRSSDPQLSSQISQTLHTALEQHVEGECGSTLLKMGRYYNTTLCHYWDMSVK